MTLSSELLCQILDGVKGGVCAIDGASKTAFVNAPMAALLGFARTEMLGRSFFEFIDEKDVDIAGRSVERARQGISERLEVVLKHSDGSDVGVLFEVSPLCGVNGTYEGAVAVASKMSARKAADETDRVAQAELERRGATEEALRRAEAETRRAYDVLDGLAEGCQVIGFDWTYRYVNGAVATQARSSKEQLLGRTMMECFPGIESTAMFATLRRCMADRTHDRLENEFAFPDGSKGWFELRFVPVPEGTCVLSMDITERKRAEEAARRTDAGLHLLIDGVQDYGIFVLDPDGIVATWNAGAKRLTGYATEDIVGLHFGRFYPAEDIAAGKPDEELRSALTFGRVEHHGWRVRKDGTRYWANVITTPLYDPTGKHFGFAKVTRDLTEPRRLEEQFRQAQKMEAVGRLAGGVAHDFNNLLSVILSYAELLIGDLKAGDPIRDDVEEIHKAGKRAADLTRQLLMFSRQQVLEPKVVDLNDVLSSMHKMLERLVGEDVEMISLAAPAAGRVKVDPSSIEQVIMNLVVNARDAMPRGGKLTLQTANVVLDDEYAKRHVGGQAGPHVMLAVSDTGIGMDGATQARIFEPFFTTKEKDRGTGLGLSTVFGIVQQSGGSVFVYSEVGQGTTFKVYLPRVDAAVDSARPQVAAAGSRGSETILLVEDDDQVRLVARGILRRHGYQVIETRHAGEALLACERHAGPIDLLLTDVVMPQMSGPELAKRLGPTRPEMRVLCMSGYTDDDVVRHGILERDVAFLQKPITPETLTTKVREVLDASGPA